MRMRYRLRDVLSFYLETIAKARPATTSLSFIPGSRQLRQRRIVLFEEKSSDVLRQRRSESGRTVGRQVGMTGAEIPMRRTAKGRGSDGAFSAELRQLLAQSARDGWMHF